MPQWDEALEMDINNGPHQVRISNFLEASGMGFPLLGQTLPAQT